MSNKTISKYSILSTTTLENGKKVNLVYSTRSGLNVLLSDENYKNLINNDIKTIDEATMKALCDALIIVDESEDQETELVINRKLEVFKDRMQSEVLYISYQATANCQLGCYYCGQEHDKTNIDEATIKATLDRVVSKIKPYHKRLLVSWFGGEPLLARKQMAILNSDLKRIARENELEYSTKLTTNGVSLTRDLFIQLVNEYNVYGIEVTLDGTAEFHDKRRCFIGGAPSFDVIFNNLSQIVDLMREDESMRSCKVSIRCNIDDNNVECVYPLLEKMKNNGFFEFFSFYTARIHSWAQNDADKLVSEDSYAAQEIDHLIDMFNFDMPIAVLPKNSFANCMALSNDSEMYDAYGNIFDCSEASYSSVYQDTTLVLGSVHKEKNNTLSRSYLFDFINDLADGKFPECLDCKFLPACTPCPKSMYEDTVSCPTFIHNIKDRMFLDYYMRTSKKQ